MPKNHKRFPHAILTTEHQYPQQGQITIFAMTGGAERHLRMEIDPKLNSACWVRDVVRRLPDYVCALGAVTGAWINFRPDFAFRIDRQGNILEFSEKAATTFPTFVRVGHDATAEDRLAVAALVGLKIDTRPTVH